MGWRYLRMRDDEQMGGERIKHKIRELKNQLEDLCEEMDGVGSYGQRGDYGQRGGQYRESGDQGGVRYRDDAYGERGYWVPRGEIVDDYVDERMLSRRGSDGSYGERRGVRGTGPYGR